VWEDVFMKNRFVPSAMSILVFERKCTMDIMEAMRIRKSIRAYTPEPVPKDVMKELLEAALLAPTGSNSQPWKFYVVSGERKKQLDDVMQTCLKGSHKTSNELQMGRDGGDTEVQDKIAARRMKLLQEATEILRNNDVPIEKFATGSFLYFGAPVAIFITMDQSLAENTLVAVGAAVQNLMLLACEKGLGTCWIGMALMYSQEIRETLNIPESERIITSLALGYPDDEAPINSFKAAKEDPETFIEWIGWD
jgi:nitroreductase